MFDLITGTAERPLRKRSPASKLVAFAVHVVIITLVVAVPLLRATRILPPVPSMLAFVTPVAPTPPPPPPPPRAPAPKSVASPEQVKPAPSSAAPVEAPTDVHPEPPRPASSVGVAGGVDGGIEGGVIGGVADGIVGGLVTAVPPPPPQAPVRIGGQLTAPALLTRVEPVYPDLARVAQVGGVVILEAVVGTDGCVDTVKVLRSPHPLLERAATDALKQWRYSPLVLNGVPVRFVLTVTFSFSVGK